MIAWLTTAPSAQIEFPSILLPPNISSGSIVDITVARNFASEQKTQASFVALQDAIYHSFGASEPQPPVLRCRNATQTSVVLEWDPIQHATADVISLSLYRNNQKAGNIPRPTVMQSTKISGLAVDKEYTFHLTLRTSAGTYSSEKVTVKTHKMTDLSGITVTPGILPAQLKDSLTKAVERIGGKIADTVRIDTTHFVTVEGRGMSWEKAVEMNIPVVRPEWVEGCESAGKIVGVRQYYLDADPRQRQVAHTQQQQQNPEPARQAAPSPQPPQQQQQGSTPSVDATSPTAPAPPAKDEPKGKGKAEAEEESSDEEEEKSGQIESEKQVRPDEQKVRVDDVDVHRVALRPTESAPEPENEAEKDEEDDDEDEEEEAPKDEKEEEAAAGTLTPGNASFQDVAL
jgi:hypothetical protein